MTACVCVCVCVCLLSVTIVVRVATTGYPFLHKGIYDIVEASRRRQITHWNHQITHWNQQIIQSRTGIPDPTRSRTGITRPHRSRTRIIKQQEIQSQDFENQRISGFKRKNFSNSSSSWSLSLQSPREETISMDLQCWQTARAL